MKYKKYNYILIFILMLVVGINNVYAENKKTCYYISEDDNLKVSLSINNNFDNPPGIISDKWATATIWQTAKGKEPIKPYGITNWFLLGEIGNQTIPMVYKSVDEANKDNNAKCPMYIIYTECPGFLDTGWFGATTKKAYATDSSMLASNSINAVNTKCDYAKYASNYKDGKQITEDMFFADFVTSGLIEYDESKKEYTCADMDVLFGKKNDDGETYDPDKDGTPSIRYLVNQALGYVRIIVPILIILYGTIDFAKAVLAGKQDNMKKAQSDFIKRLIAGVVVFLVPTIVDIVMELADIVWAGEYIHCDF